MDELRKPVFFLAVFMIVLAVLVELGAAAVLGVNLLDAANLASALDAPTPGYGIPYLALLDGLVLYTVLLISASLIFPERVHGRVQGVVTLVVSLLILVVAIGMLIMAFVLLNVMVALLLSPPFGTIAYFAIYAHFNTNGARITLSLLMMLKLIFVVCLLLAHVRFLQNKGLVLMLLTSLLGNFLIGFLHAFVPGVLVSITDDIAAIIIAILVVIWAVVFLIGALISVVKAIA